jgi:hypothetical protein
LDLAKTKSLIFDGILGGGNAHSTHDESLGIDVSSGRQEAAGHQSRVFGITKAELSFLNEFFYSRHALIFANGFSFLRLFLSTLLLGAISYMAFTIHQYAKIAKLDELGRVHHGVFFTSVLLSLLGLTEIIDVAGYVFSDWTKVLLVCNYARHPWWLRGWVMEIVVRLLCRFSPVKRWHGKMGQYNLLFGRRRRCIVTLIDLPEEVKKAVFLLLKSLRNPSQDSYLDRALSTFSDELRQKIHEKVTAFDGDVHKILLWHIATCYCEFHLADTKGSVTSRRTGPFVEQNELGDIKEHYITAISLSQYCAHMLRLQPPLIPRNEILNSGVLDRVIWETNRTLWRCFSSSTIFQRLQTLTQPGAQDDTRSSLEIREDESATLPQDDNRSYLSRSMKMNRPHSSRMIIDHHLSRSVKMKQPTKIRQTMTQ